MDVKKKDNNIKAERENMSLSAKEFKELIEKDPAWAQRLDRPVEIRTYCNMDGSKITHLSPWLHFKGKDKEGNAASFKGCQNLEVAEGVFDGFVDFGVDYPEDENGDIILGEVSYVGVKKIGDLKITTPNLRGYAADFTGCPKLKEYKGTYPGHVDIGHNELLQWISELQGEHVRQKIKIKDLKITGENNKGYALSIHNGIVKELGGHYESAIRLVGSEVDGFGELTIKPNPLGIKLSLKNTLNQSLVNFKGFARDFPMEASEVELPKTKRNPSSGAEVADELTELRDILKIKKAMAEAARKRARESLKEINTNTSWVKKVKHTAVRSIAHYLKADDILKKEGMPAKSKSRLKNLMGVSAIAATIVLSTGGSTVTEIFKEIRANTIVKPAALEIQSHLSKENLSNKIKEINTIRQFTAEPPIEDPFTAARIILSEVCQNHCKNTKSMAIKQDQYTNQPMLSLATR
jgi:hypothetical protein